MFSKKYLFLLISVLSLNCAFSQLQAPSTAPDPGI